MVNCLVILIFVRGRMFFQGNFWRHYLAFKWHWQIWK